MIRCLLILQSILMKLTEKHGELSDLEQSEDELLILQKRLLGENAQLFARFHKFGNDFQHMIRLARVHFAAHIFRQARVGQLFAQAHGRAFCWIGSAFIL